MEMRQSPGTLLITHSTTGAVPPYFAARARNSLRCLDFGGSPEFCAAFQTDRNATFAISSPPAPEIHPLIPHSFVYVLFVASRGHFLCATSHRHKNARSLGARNDDPRSFPPPVAREP